MATVPVQHSATLQINEAIGKRRARGETVLHLGFGEAGLPVLPELAAVLGDAATHNSYGPVAGADAARASVAGYLTRRGLPTEVEQVILAPGSKALLYAAIAGLPGDVVLPVPSWVSYAAQAALAGRRVVAAPIPEGCGGVPDPERLGESLRAARAAGADPRILVLTLPDNPTGTLAPAPVVAEVCRLADEQGLVVVSDEIYRDLADRPDDVHSPASLLADHVVVTGGLSKNLALGGWRIGFARVPQTAWGRQTMHQLVGIGSEVWSALPAPMQRVAEVAFSEPDGVRDRVTASRRLHAQVRGAVHRVFADAGALCRVPSAAFYLYPDLEPFRDAFSRRSADDAESAARLLLKRHGVGMLPGAAFSDDPKALRFRVATSLLYGEGDQRQVALDSDDPASLPWVADALHMLEGVLAELTRG